MTADGVTILRKVGGFDFTSELFKIGNRN